MRFFVLFSPTLSPHFCIVKQKHPLHVILTLMTKHVFLSICLVFSAGILAAQGWERVYGGSGRDEIYDLALCPDGGYVLSGNYNLQTNVYLIKTDADGDLQWTKNYPADFGTSGNSVIPTRDSGFVVAGFIKVLDANNNPNRNAYLLRLDAYGNLKWAKNYGGNFDEELLDVVELPGGGFAMTGYREDAAGKPDLYLLKVDAAGNFLWQQSFGQPSDKEIGNGLVVMPNGDLIAAGESTGAINSDIYILRTNAAGDLLWENYYDFSAGKDDKARALVLADDNQLVLSGFTTVGAQSIGLIAKVGADGVSTSPVWTGTFPSADIYGLAKDNQGGYFVTGTKASVNGIEDLYVARTSAIGAVIWEPTVGKPGIDIGRSVVATPDGGCAAAGYSEPYVSTSGTGQPAAYLVKTDANGRILTSWLEAYVFRDFNADCQPTTGEPELKNWIVRIERVADKNTLYAVSNEEGRFRFPVDTGDYDLKLFAPNEVWRTCEPTIRARVGAFYDTVEVLIPLRSVNDCPRNEIDLAAPVLRRCADNTWTVRYCNSGTVPSFDTRVDIQLDKDFALVGSSVPNTPKGNNVYTFDIGTLANGDCGNFTFTAHLDCDKTEDGQAHCVQAHIFPDDFCGAKEGWDSVIIVAKALCENNKVKLILQNVGKGNMGGTLGYIITEDVVMLTAPGDPISQFRLNTGQEMTVYDKVANGKTYRVIADQSPGYPGLGTPTAAVEGCKTDTSTTPISTGFYTMFPENDADVFVESDCQESTPTDYNPIYLKRGHPKGYDEARFVDSKTDLEYLIQFRNTTNDTVRQVVVRDTLSAALDPATVFPGASSHPYEFEVYGQGIVQFTLSNLTLLPGSSGSASEGFVKFRVAQKPNLTCQTAILNRAAVWFDFNQPVVSNETKHTGGCPIDTFAVVKTIVIHNPGANLKVYPNPFVESATFEITDVQARDYALELYDIQGRLYSIAFFNHPKFRLFRHQVPSGIAIYRLTADGRPVATGKLLTRD